MLCFSFRREIELKVGNPPGYTNELVEPGVTKNSK